MQLSVDGFVAGPGGELDWMTWDWTEDIKKYVTDFTEAADTIIMGRVLYQGMSGHWTSIPADNEEYAFAQIMNSYEKVVFSTTRPALAWNNSRLAEGTLEEEIARLKKQPGKDIITYGGARFAAHCVRLGLIDEFHLFVNPVALGKGLSIFRELEGKLNLKLTNSQSFDCGIVLLCYQLK